MEATWEEVKVIQKHYPNFNLDDNVNFNEGGIVKDSNIKKIVTETSSKGKEFKSIGGMRHMA